MKKCFARTGLFFALPVVLLFSPAGLSAQQKITMSDAILKGRTALAPANLRQLQWIPGSSQFTYAAGSRIVRTQASNLKTDTIDVLPRVNEGLASLGVKTLEVMPPVTWVNADKFSFNSGREIYTFSFTEGISRKNGYPDGAENMDVHDKTYAAAYTKDDGLWINIGGKELGVAKSEGPGIVYGKSVHREEFGIYKGTFWSNTGRYLAFYRMDESMVTTYPIYELDSMPAKVRDIRYPFAGSKSHHVTVGVYDTQTGQKLYLNTGLPAEQYLTNVSWSADDKYVLIAVVNREQNHTWLRQYDAATGAFVKTIFEETSDKWVEPEHPAIFVPGSNDQFLWQSERDGYNHLYLCSLSGAPVRQISKGAMPVVNFYGFDTRGENCYFQVADESGLNRYVYSANLKNGTTTRLSGDEGIHNGLVNSTGEWALDVFSSKETPRTIYVQSIKKPTDRKIVFSAKNPLEGYELGQTKMVTLPSPGGVSLNARMILPTHFDEKMQYPALIYVYNGPHVQMVTNGWLAGGELWMHHMAEEGYVIFVLDGRGSANRGFAFESAIHRRIGDCEIEDQMTGVDYLKAQTFVDPKRIGVYGWSYGGHMATSLMSRPEGKSAFRCGVAGGPVLDWDMYEIMYTERYMDTPKENPEGYKKNDLFNYIDNLSGRLLMIHGSSDNVVLWQHSLRYIRECVRHGKQIDYFVYPEHEHNVLGPERVHLFEKIEQFFNENLRDVKTDRP